MFRLECSSLIEQIFGMSRAQGPRFLCTKPLNSLISYDEN